MNIGTIGNMAVIAKGLPIIKFGFELMKKENKNEDEQKAAKSFLKFFSLACAFIFLVVILIFITCTITVLDIGVGYGGNKQNEEKIIFDVMVLFCTMIGSIIFLIGYALIAQGTVGKQFALYYNLSLKESNEAWISEGRKNIYENIFRQKFAQKKTIWLSGILSLIYLLIFAGIAISSVLIIGGVNTSLPNQNMILVSRIFGIAFELLYIVLIFLCVKYDKSFRPLYSVGEHLLETQLLEKNTEGKIGYYNRQNQWIELQSVIIKQQDDKIAKIKCKYKITSNGREFSNYNYIAMDDMMFPLIMEMSKSDKKASSNSGKHIWLIFIIFLINILLIGGSVILLK